MPLSNELISQFVKATKDDKKTSTESTVYGTTVVYDGRTYVKLDGSDLLTPVTTTTDVKSDERVTVMIKNHTATITGNITSPAARTDDVQELGNQISEVEILVADKVSTEELEATNARIDELRADNVVIKEKLTASEAEIGELKADVAEIGDLKADKAEITRLLAEKLDATVAAIKYATIESLEAVDASVHNLEATYGEFQELTTKNFDAVNAEIENLEATKLTAEQVAAKFATIDFSNIGEAAIKKLFTDSGIIEDLVVSEGRITGELVGVTIKGDWIEAGTLKADKLVVRGENGIYYKLNLDENGVAPEGVSQEELQNGLHGTHIIAKTITAEKVAVDDLVAFDATIGGFNITNEAIYSGVKSSADNTTRGVYMDREGQLSVGDSNNFLRYYREENGEYRLEISASSLIFSTSGKSVADTIDEVREEAIDAASNIQIGARNLIRNSATLVFDKYYFTTSPSAIAGLAIAGLTIVGKE